ncbi:uncharacterized protein M421DRAFT_425909 [Didymella exigua CBS 183.55]|uniref:Rhodopsin domain-containing protein n=1 Tax=Didymella exigua CBS 183.55 TaxID=1150837 RepID=A0A6A5R5H7_9PLEO|nr:uncharacterized protein M421DRAFT_425909 [Didymella exigua CBS 183.55]KAF1923381.1 hypothetical protein M421DRAFT_425909 [Didymella exigua CBS 183.55]
MAIPNRGPELVGVNVAFMATAVIANALRCIVRVKMVKAFGVDDCLMVASTIFFVGYGVTSTIGAHYGTGRHHRDLEDWQVDKARKCWFYCYLFYCCSMILSKISIGCFLLRISVKRIHTWIIYAAMFVSTFACTAFFFVTLFQCHPIRYFWAKSLPDGICINNTVIIALGFVYSIFSIIADFTFALLPAALVWNLQLKRRTKIALIPLLTMGCVASAAVIARLPSLPKLNSPDFLWDTLDVAIWSSVEQGLAITAGSLATLRPLFALVMHQIGLSTRPTQPRPSQYGLQTPPASQMLNSRRKGSKNELDMYKLTNVEETRVSDDSLAKDSSLSKSPNRFNGNGLQQSMTESRVRADNESERSLRIKSSRNSSEDQMGIMVSKSFWIDEERSSIISRGQDPRFR